MWCKRENILLSFNCRNYVEFELLIEQQNRNSNDGSLKEIAKADTETWNLLNYSERCDINRDYSERCDITLPN